MSSVWVSKVLDLLEEHYGQARTALDYQNGLQLLIATILSAQCTDVRVNQITPILFDRYETAADYANASQDEIEQIIRGCGLYRNKARFIREACRLIVAEFNGSVPRTRKELMTLPGVGRKTANVVLANIFNKDAIAVDTHVFRVSNRVGLADSDKVLEVEKQLMDKIPQQKWSEAHHWLIYHGRAICKARKPLCKDCFLVDLCQYAQGKCTG